MHSRPASSNACSRPIRCLRGTACSVVMPTRSLHGAAPSLVPARRQRLILLHASDANRRSPLAHPGDAECERLGNTKGQPSDKQRAQGVVKSVSDAGKRSHHAQGEPEDDPELQRFAQELFGKPYQQLSASQKRTCAGKKGQAHSRAALQKSIKGDAADEVLQAIAWEKFGKDLADVTEQELKACVASRAARARWQAHGEQLQRVAQEKYGKPYGMLTPEEQRACSGTQTYTKRAVKAEQLVDYAAMPTDQALDMIALEKLGKPYKELDQREKKTIINIKYKRTKNLRARLAEEAGDP